MNIVEFNHVVSILDGLVPKPIVNKGLVAAGVDRSLLTGKAGFIPYSAEAVLLETVARAIGDRHLGARVGREFKYSTYGAYASYLLSAPDLATALDRGRRALYLTHPGSEILFRKTDTHLVVGRDSKGMSVIGYRHLDEGALFVIAQVAHHFLGPDWVPDWYEIPASHPDGVRDLEAIAGTEVRTDAVVPGVAIRFEDLGVLNPAPLQKDVALTLEELATLMKVAPRQAMKESVSQILHILSESQVSDENSVAKLLAISPRSMQRALKAEGTTYRDIRLRVALERACSMLSETDAPIEEIARKTGYSDPRSFRRAFKAGIGQSPSAFRKAFGAGQNGSLPEGPRSDDLCQV